jgi:hypothetical protein
MESSATGGKRPSPVRSHPRNHAINRQLKGPQRV